MIVIQSIDRHIVCNTTQRMKQSNMTDQINTAKADKPVTNKMVSFRMPMAYVEQLQQQAQALGKSKSQVVRMGLDALKGNGGQ